MLTMYLAILSSANSLHSSSTTKKRSNLDIIGALISKLNLRLFDLSYLPNKGLAAAKIEALAFKVA